ncbi:hypothetical protein [Natronorubrum thiooxidans]|uniref:Uncharacterized protein n=1 Tax=Natronorubrum thiooxidans TaxID=308853 RepID=A0A1N7HAF4_9EURY|nr:hypothetical protein [Natronorubrum thiooxidans]SIS21731.1 hypothetical protein SAMN05421752_1407 [Natronorubrum thiooxidans]
MSIDQTTLEVGETRPPAVLENVRTTSIGDIVVMVMCTHRFEPDDVMGWHTHNPMDVTREWVQQNAEATVARLLGDDAQTHSTRSAATPSLETESEPTLNTSEDYKFSRPQCVAATAAGNRCSNPVRRTDETVDFCPRHGDADDVERYVPKEGDR